MDKYLKEFKVARVEEEAQVTQLPCTWMMIPCFGGGADIVTLRKDFAWSARGMASREVFYFFCFFCFLTSRELKLQLSWECGISSAQGIEGTEPWWIYLRVCAQGYDPHLRYHEDDWGGWGVLLHGWVTIMGRNGISACHWQSREWKRCWSNHVSEIHQAKRVLVRHLWWGRSDCEDLPEKEHDHCFGSTWRREGHSQKNEKKGVGIEGRGVWCLWLTCWISGFL